MLLTNYHPNTPHHPWKSLKNKNPREPDSCVHRLKKQKTKRAELRDLEMHTRTPTALLQPKINVLKAR